MNVLRAFQTTGADLFAAGLNNSHSGNLSVRLGRTLAITRTGAMLHRLDHADIVETALDHDDAQTRRASRELPVHRAIYRGTAHDAIVHAHPPHVIALSLSLDRIRPVDAEGTYYFPQGVPVVAVRNPIASEEVGAVVAPLLRTCPLVVVRGHGTFAVGSTLEDGLHWTTSLEHSARILCLHLSLARGQPS
jgi:L-fuculose-phosphate aldolase